MASPWGQSEAFSVTLTKQRGECFNTPSIERSVDSEDASVGQWYKRKRENNHLLCTILPVQSTLVPNRAA